MRLECERKSYKIIEKNIENLTNYDDVSFCDGNCATSWLLSVARTLSRLSITGMWCKQSLLHCAIGAKPISFAIAFCILTLISCRARNVLDKGSGWPKKQKEKHQCFAIALKKVKLRGHLLCCIQPLRLEKGWVGLALRKPNQEMHLEWHWSLKDI